MFNDHWCAALVTHRAVFIRLGRLDHNYISLFIPGEILCIPALGITGTTKKIPVPTYLDEHLLATDIALYTGRPRRGLEILHFFLGLCMFLDVLGVENLHALHVSFLAFFYLVQGVFHACCETHIYDVGIVLHQQPIYIPAQLCWFKYTFLQPYIAPFLYSGDSGCIGAGPAYALFLEFLYKGCLGVAWRRLSKVLFGSGFYQV